MSTIPSSYFDIIQDQKLQELLAYTAVHSPFYKRLFESNSIDIAAITTVKDLHKIPTTCKQDLQEYNQDFVCVTPDKIIDYVTTSGTQGSPVLFVLTEKDLERLAYNECKSLQHAGITADDIVQLTVTMDRRFMAGIAYCAGLRKIGAGTIRVGPGNPELQWDTILKIKANVLIAVPSFAIKLIEYAKAKNIDYQQSTIRKIICVGEPIRNQDFSFNKIGSRITEQWDVQLFSTYASTEMGTAFTESEWGNGGRLIPELAIIETLDDYDQPVADGTIGELTVTTLGTEGMPLIRFRTGDLCAIHREPCPSGFAAWRISPIVGRKNQMIKYKGTTLYPQALNDVLNGIDEVSNYYIEVSTDSMDNDNLIAYICSAESNDKLVKKIKDTFRAKLRVSPHIKFVSDADITQVKNHAIVRKPIDFVDLR